MKKQLLAAGIYFRMNDIRKYVKNLLETLTTSGAIEKTFIDDDGQVRRAEFFGKETLLKLLNDKSGKEVVGLRIYYGLAPENELGEISKEGRLRPRLFLVPVDENKKDVEFDSTGFKDEPNGSGAGGGFPCPQMCDN